MNQKITPEALGRALAAVRAALGLDAQAEIPTRSYDALIEGWYALLNEPSGGSGQLPQAAPAAAGVPDEPNYERMFIAACAALAEVSRELGCAPDQGGAEPIMEAIRELRQQRDESVDDCYALSGQPAAQPQAEQNWSPFAAYRGGWMEGIAGTAGHEGASIEFFTGYEDGQKWQAEQQAEQQGADERFPNGLADAVAYADALEHAAAALFEQVLGHETDGSDTGPDMLARVATALATRQPYGDDGKPMVLVSQEFKAQAEPAITLEIRDKTRALLDALDQYSESVTALAVWEAKEELEDELALIDGKAVRS